MSKVCPKCGSSNEDSRSFCSVCGGPLDTNLKLIMDFKRYAHKEVSQEPQNTSRYDDMPLTDRKPVNNKFPIVPVAVGVGVLVVIIICICLILLL